MPPVDVHATLVTLLATAVIAVAAPVVVAVLLFAALMLLVHLLPVLLVHRRMLPENAAALVGAGVLTVLVLPAVAVGLRRRDADAPVAGSVTPAPGVDGTTGRAVAPG